MFEAQSFSETYIPTESPSPQTFANAWVKATSIEWEESLTVATPVRYELKVAYRISN
jgi:hypothetical protein